MTVVSAILSIGTGYAFGTMRFFGDRIMFPLMLLGIIFPYEATVIPLYYDFQNVPLLHWNLLNTYWALILPQIGQSVAFGTFWMRAFFRSVPRSLIEAARIDGATSFGVLWRVLLPQAMPAVLTMCVLVFTYTWNEFLLALVLVLGQPVAPDRAARPQLLRRRRARRRSHQGGGRGGARGAADRGRVPLPATAFRRVECSAGRSRSDEMARIKLVYLGEARRGAPARWRRSWRTGATSTAPRSCSSTSIPTGWS